MVEGYMYGVVMQKSPQNKTCFWLFWKENNNFCAVDIASSGSYHHHCEEVKLLSSSRMEHFISNHFEWLCLTLNVWEMQKSWKSVEFPCNLAAKLLKKCPGASWNDPTKWPSRLNQVGRKIQPSGFCVSLVWASSVFMNKHAYLLMAIDKTI